MHLTLFEANHQSIVHNLCLQKINQFHKCEASHEAMVPTPLLTGKSQFVACKEVMYSERPLGSLVRAKEQLAIFLGHPRHNGLTNSAGLPSPVW